ncbi:MULTISPECIES: glycosyltransferase family 2 protein [Vagococcus]|uniref:glycosyltransferase family 2 protein n=1 Tax=Vagococcus TaxID=2737 RepID=UPI000E4CC5DF|nr:MULTISPECIES: glycosyltransferase family 2 protein [Vagococcus]RHH71555.1 glycosyltransferase family 2 protein [Vagococcus sp. AM17-17]
MKVLIIIPAYNEDASILSTIRSIDKYKSENHSLVLDYVVINDGSTDNTARILSEHGISSIHLISNLGIGGAVQTGYLYAFYKDYDIAVQFDGDGQHDISSLKTLINPIINGDVDFTIGSRFVEGSPSKFKTSLFRRMGINLISFFIKFRTGEKILDVTSGYRAANKEIIEYFSKNYPRKYPEPETNAILIKKGKRVEEVGVNMFERKEGKSSITPFKSVRYMVEVLTSIILLSDKGE